MMEVNTMTTKRISPLAMAMAKKQAAENQIFKSPETKEVATANYKAEDVAELKKHKYCGIKPNTKQPDCRWTTQSSDWDTIKSKSDLAIVIPKGYIVVDIDDETEGKALLRFVQDASEYYGYPVSCVMRTDHGYHFWFRQPADESLDSIGIKHTSKIKTLLTVTVDYRVGGKGYMVIRRNNRDREWVVGSWSDLANVEVIPDILHPIAPTDDSHKALYKSVCGKYGYQINDDNTLLSYYGLPKGQRTTALLSYYGYLKAESPNMSRDINLCKRVIWYINQYLCAEAIPEDELCKEILNNENRVTVQDRAPQKKRVGGGNISLNLHAQAANHNKEEKTPIKTTKSNLSYEDMAQEIIDTYDIIYYSGNYYRYNNGVYEALDNKPKDSELLIERMIMGQYPGLLARQKKEITRNIKTKTMISHSNDNGNLLALNNGIYNVSDHTFQPWEDVEDGKYHFFSRIPITFNSLVPVDQTIVDFENYRSSLFPEETAEDYKKVLDQILGYTFYRKLPAQKIFFLYGPGGTGKSTYANFLRRLIGVSNTRSVTLDRIISDRFILASLENKMMNIGDETITAESIKSVDLLKSLAVDSNIEVEAKYKDSRNIELYTKHIFCSNERPQTQDKAFWDRVIVVPFTNVFRNTDNNIPDEKLKRLMDSETIKSYMFNLAMAELKELQANNWQFTITAEMQAAKDDFVPTSDNPIEVWIRDANINEDTISDYDAPDIPIMYKQWCAQHNYRYCGRNKLISYLKEVYPITIKRRRRNGHTVTYFKVDIEIDD